MPVSIIYRKPRPPSTLTSLHSREINRLIRTRTWVSNRPCTNQSKNGPKQQRQQDLFSTQSRATWSPGCRTSRKIWSVSQSPPSPSASTLCSSSAPSPRSTVDASSHSAVSSPSQSHSSQASVYCTFAGSKLLRFTHGFRFCSCVSVLSTCLSYVRRLIRLACRGVPTPGSTKPSPMPVPPSPQLPPRPASLSPSECSVRFKPFARFAYSRPFASLCFSWVRWPYSWP